MKEKRKFSIVGERWYVLREIWIIVKTLRVQMPRNILRTAGSYGKDLAWQIDPKGERTEIVAFEEKVS